MIMSSRELYAIRLFGTRIVIFLSFSYGTISYKHLFVFFISRDVLFRDVSQLNPKSFLQPAKQSVSTLCFPSLSIPLFTPINIEYDYGLHFQASWAYRFCCVLRIHIYVHIVETSRPHALSSNIWFPTNTQSTLHCDLYW